MPARAGREPVQRRRRRLGLRRLALGARDDPLVERPRAGSGFCCACWSRDIAHQSNSRSRLPASRTSAWLRATFEELRRRGAAVVERRRLVEIERLSQPDEVLDVVARRERRDVDRLERLARRARLATSSVVRKRSRCARASTTAAAAGGRRAPARRPSPRRSRRRTDGRCRAGAPARGRRCAAAPRLTRAAPRISVAATASTIRESVVRKESPTSPPTTGVKIPDRPARNSYTASLPPNQNTPVFARFLASGVGKEVEVMEVVPRSLALLIVVAAERIRDRRGRKARRRASRPRRSRRSAAA